ncbi:MAG: hypothetical protein HY670_08965 [Chloroflexi bacterium]|nr:hypothetical protein [Chloroflexota bacterium]
MENKRASAATERAAGVISLLSVGEVSCNKCGGTIRYLDRYCYQTHECPVCGAVLDSINALETHFSLEGHAESPRGTRYCTSCASKAGYLRTVKNKKTGEVRPSMFVLRDEEDEVVKENNRK